MSAKPRSEAVAIGAIVMAAGAGRRMGNVPKSLLRRQGEPLLLRQIRLAADAGVTAIVVVLGHHAERLATVLDGARPRAATWGAARVARVTNPDPDRGTGSSLRCGLDALPANLAAWLVLLADQPLLEVGDVRAVVRAWNMRPAGAELVVPEHAGQPGHPIVFGRALRDAVLGERGGRGVREWRHAHPERVMTLHVPHTRCTTDVDVPADLERLYDEHQVRLEWPEGYAQPRRSR